MNKSFHLLLLGASYKLKLAKPLNQPYQFSIEPTNICNFKCIFCPQSNSVNLNARKKGSLSLTDLKLFIDQIQSVRPGNKNISLTLDGEPTLNKDFPEFIRLINDQGMFPRFSSNARNLMPDYVDSLLSKGSFLASVDFASEAKYFDNIRGNKGDFEIVLSNLKYLVNIAEKNPRVKLEIVNISHFNGADPDTTLNDLRRLFPEHLPENISFWSREFHNFCGHLEQKSKNTYKLCPYPWTSFNVTWEGDVVPCCRDTQAKTVLGNVFRSTMMEIWHGTEYQALRKKLVAKEIDSIEACKDCDLPWSSGSRRWNVSYMIPSLLRR